MKIYRFLFFILIGAPLVFQSCSKESDTTPDENRLLPNWQSGQVIKDENQWFECHVGDIPLVISVPHGGSIKPDHLPDRDCEGATTVKDTYTVELAKAIQEAFAERYNKKPFVIFSNLARTKVDQNRSLEEALCESHPETEEAWHWFHNYVDSAVRYATDQYGEAMYIDLHAHGHDIQRLELGYGLTVSQIGQVYSGINLEESYAASSMANYKQIDPSSDFRELLMGESAFGTLMADKDIPSVPSKQNPYPMSTEPYFNGGYNTRYYTSGAYPNVYGWQIETHSLARNTPERRVKFAEAFAETVMQLLNI